MRQDPESWRDQPYLMPTPPQVNFSAGQVVNFTIFIQSEHLGFYVFRICDKGLDGTTLKSRQDGEDCLNKHVLKQAYDEKAPQDNELPIDEKHPERWHVPADVPKNQVRTAHFWLPKDLECTNCVVQWWWHSGILARKEL